MVQRLLVVISVVDPVEMALVRSCSTVQCAYYLVLPTPLSGID